MSEPRVSDAAVEKEAVIITGYLGFRSAEYVAPVTMNVWLDLRDARADLARLHAELEAARAEELGWRRSAHNASKDCDSFRDRLVARDAEVARLKGAIKRYVDLWNDIDTPDPPDEMGTTNGDQALADLAALIAPQAGSGTEGA